MGIKRVISISVEVLLLLVISALVLGVLIGQPILVSYVETGSMEPTLDAGDGFVAIPTEAAGPIEPGDVIVFEAEEIQGGGLTTHRVVEVTDRGFVTRGDANPLTDQAGGEPPVQRAQVVAVAWQPGGEVFAIPGVGTAVEGSQSALEAVQRHLAALFGTRTFLGVQGLAYLLFGLSIGLYGLDVWRNHRAGRSRSRSRSHSTGTSGRTYALVFSGAIVLAATAAMVAPAGIHEFGVVSAEFESDRPDVIQQGTSESTPYAIGNGGFVPVVSYFEPESEGVTVDPERVTIPGQTAVNATMTLSAPPDPGYYQFFLTEHRYLQLLPLSAIETLYRIHPWAPVLAIDALLGVPVYLLSVQLLGSGRLRSRSREKPSRIRRLLARFT